MRLPAETGKPLSASLLLPKVGLLVGLLGLHVVANVKLRRRLGLRETLLHEVGNGAGAGLHEVVGIGSLGYGCPISTKRTLSLGLSIKLALL